MGRFVGGVVWVCVGLGTCGLIVQYSTVQYLKETSWQCL